MMNKQNIKSTIEALLFACGEPLSFTELKDILQVDDTMLEKCIDELMIDFEDDSRGIKIVKYEQKYQLCSKEEFSCYIEKMLKPKKRTGLSQAALETLSIIAYKQPITRAEVEEIRGVKCEKAINTLLDKNIIEEAGRLEGTGRPIIYKTTIEFLKYFGLSSIKELPRIEEFNVTIEEENTL